MASSRDIAKKAGSAAIERTIESLMPELFRRLDRIDERFSRIEERFAGFDRELHGLRQHIDDRFEQQRDVINELGQRMAHVEGRLNEVIRSMDRQSERLDKQTGKMDQWIERLVRLETTQGVRRGKRAS
jgi:chaperonin cofactor prefoldin